jgi:uncharacterized membrane protein YraQ (UPF0718 family)
MDNPVVIIVFGISMVLAVAWIVQTSFQNIKRRRELEKEVWAQEQQKDQTAQQDAQDFEQ